jgi:hypothetical protein
MASGIYYWEVIINEGSVSPLKIGVSLRKDMDLNKAFSDYESGFAFLTTGYLRRGNDRQGTVFGRPCGPNDIIGCCLNLSKGTLSYSINGVYQGRIKIFYY